MNQAKFELLMKPKYKLLLRVIEDGALDSGELQLSAALVTRIAHEGLGVTRASIWSWSPGGNAMDCLFLNDSKLGCQTKILPNNKALFPTGEKSCPKEMRVINNVNQHPETKPGLDQYFAPQGISSILDAPFFHVDGTVTLLCCEHQGESRQWSIADATLAGFLAGALGRAIVAYNTRLVASQLTQFNEELEQKVSARAGELLSLRTQFVEAEKFAALGRMVAGVAHEVNTPIGIAMTSTSHMCDELDNLMRQLEDKTLTQSQFEHYMADTKQGFKLLDDNINKAISLITSFQKVATNQSQTESIEFSPNEIIDSVLLTLKPELKKHPVAILIDVPSACYITNEPGALSQILTHLVQNSLIHGFPDHQGGKILITIKSTSHGITLRYRDDGIGIPETNIRHVFEPFYTTLRGQKHAGLGLNIVQNLTSQSLGGIITPIKSGPGFEILFQIPSLKVKPSVFSNLLEQAIEKTADKQKLAITLQQKNISLASACRLGGELGGELGEELKQHIFDSASEQYFWPGLNAEPVFKAAIARALDYDLPVCIYWIEVNQFENPPNLIRSKIKRHSQKIELYFLTPAPRLDRQDHFYNYKNA